MNGKGSITFLALFLDTASLFTMAELHHAYVTRGRMAEWEFAFWCGQLVRDENL